MRSIARVVGDLLITTGVVILLYVVYLLWWTDVVAHQAAQGDMCTLGREWARSIPVQPRAAQPFATL